MNLLENNYCDKDKSKLYRETSEILAHWDVIIFTQTCAGLEQYAIQKFAESLEAIPRTLAENAGVKATEVISKLYAAHQGGDKNAGFDNEVMIRRRIV